MKKKIIYFLIYGGFLIFLMTACSSEDIDSQDVVAQVNAAIVTNAELENAITPTTSTEVRQALKRKLMEKWIEDEIFYQAALEEGLTLSKGELFLVENYRKQLLIEKYLEKHVDITYRVLDHEIEDYYKKHRSEFVWDDNYAHLIHLVMENRDQVISNEINKSKDLLEVIKNNFFDQQSTLQRPNGDLGYVRLSDLPPRLADQIKSMKTGTIKGPIKTDFGYHYVQLLDRQEPNSVKDLDIVRDEVIMRIKLQKRQNEIKRLKQKLRTNFTIQTDLSKLNQP
jgi:peptidyl-prolyl cis-trans isomerase C